MALHDPDPVQQKSGSMPTPAPFRVLVVPDRDDGENSHLTIAGLSTVERQRRQLDRLGAVPNQEMSRDIAQLGAPLLVIEAGLVVDDRLLAAFLEAARDRGSSAPALLAVGPDGKPGGLAWLSESSGLPDWDSLLAGPHERVELAAVDTYSPDRRRHVPLLWERPRDVAAARQVAAKILHAAQKGCLDWPARFIHPPIEDAMVRLLWSSPITPNMISLLAFGLGLYAAWCFATGALWTGLLIALAIGPIDGIDGKLARTRVEFSRWGDLEHVGDKIVEYAWFAGLAAAIGTAWAGALAALTITTALAEALLGEFYRRMTGTQLDDAGRFERAYRLISGRRNTFFWTLLPFAWLEAWSAGLVMIAVYATTNFFVILGRFFIRLADYGRAHSATIAANLAATAYGMLDSRSEEVEPRGAIGAIGRPPPHAASNLGMR